MASIAQMERSEQNNCTNVRRQLFIFKQEVCLNCTNVRRQLFIFKVEVCLNFTNFVENDSFSNKRCDSSSPIFVENSLFSKKEFRQTWSIFKEGVRVAVSGRVGRQFAFSYSFSTTRPRFARAKKHPYVSGPIFAAIGLMK